MGAVNFAAVIVLLIYTSNLSTTESSETVVDTDTDIQYARKAYAILTTRPQNGPDAEDLGANVVVDDAVEHFMGALEEQNMARIPIPNIDVSFKKKVALSTVHGSFKGKNGWLDGVTDIARKGDASLKLEDSTILFESLLGLDVMRMGMDFNAKFGPVRSSGKLNAQVKGNVVACSGGLKFSSGKCKLFLRKFEVKNLGKINVSLTGLGPLNWITSKVVTSVTSRMHNDIKNSVESQMREMIEKEMNDLECLPVLIPASDQ